MKNFKSHIDDMEIEIAKIQKKPRLYADDEKRIRDLREQIRKAKIWLASVGGSNE